VIAGFPRNKFKFSVFFFYIGVEHFIAQWLTLYEENYEYDIYLKK